MTMDMLRVYIRELTALAPLDEAEERALWSAYKDAGDIDSRYRLIEAYQQLVVRIVKGLAGKSPAFMDLIQEGTVGLIEAVETYDPGRNVPFGAYAQHRIRGRVLSFFAKQKHDLPAEVAWDSGGYLEEVACASDGGDDPAVAAERGDIANKLRVAVQRLPVKEAQVIKEVLLADRTPVSVAAEMKISESYLYKLEKRAIRRMRGMLSRFMAELTAPM